jgi:hypothetical protein
MSDVCWPNASETVALIKRLDSADYIVSRNEMSPIESCLQQQQKGKGSALPRPAADRVSLFSFIFYFDLEAMNP